MAKTSVMGRGTRGRLYIQREVEKGQERAEGLARGALLTQSKLNSGASVSSRLNTMSVSHPFGYV